MVPGGRTLFCAPFTNTLPWQCQPLLGRNPRSSTSLCLLWDGEIAPDVVEPGNKILHPDCGWGLQGQRDSEEERMARLIFGGGGGASR